MVSKNDFQVGKDEDVDFISDVISDVILDIIIDVLFEKLSDKKAKKIILEISRRLEEKGL